MDRTQLIGATLVLAVAAFTHLQNAAPMALLTSMQIQPPAPPSLTSERYAADFNEVRLIGNSDSGTRTAEQTSIGVPDVAHAFQGFWEAAEEQSESRIYGGIHYRFDQTTGQQIGRSAAEFVFANFMTKGGRGLVPGHGTIWPVRKES